MASSNEQERELCPPPPANRIWFHFLGLLAAATVVATLNGLVTGGAGTTLGNALRGLREGLYPLVPVAAGVAVGIGMGVRLRAAVQIVFVATAIMIGLDLMPPSGQRRVLTSTSLTPGGQIAPSAVGGGNWLAGEALRTITRLLTGDLDDADQRLSAYGPDHDRFRASHGLLKLGLLITPLVAAGIVLGLAAWIEQRVLFRSGRDEVMVMIVIAWGLSPLSVFLSYGLGTRALFGALFRDSSLGMILVAYLPSVVVGLLGWRAFRRWQGTE